MDGMSGSVLRGWARTTSDMQNRLRIEVCADGRLVASDNATIFRADLAQAGKGDGRCAFVIPLAPMPRPGTVLEVSAICDDMRFALHGSPYAVPPTAAWKESLDEADVLPRPLRAPRLHGSLDQCGPSLLRGWARWHDGARESPSLVLSENGTELLRFEASQWRPDVAEQLQGDGCCGFELPLPEVLRDGAMHELELHLAENREPVLEKPLRIRVSGNGSGTSLAPRLPTPFSRPVTNEQVTLSVVVNFYNMRREAERTLTSLRLGYQQGAGDLAYEVLCIDNGSEPPLDSDWIASFGPQFRLVRPSRLQSSPCAALNEASLQARGKYLAVMIDGAHLLTPGVFREALSAWRENPAAVVALRHWFVGGDQRWLALAGYTRKQEDRLFDRIRWPSNGYELFRIGSPIGENPEPWFDGLSESNCLMLPTSLFDRIGGFDEAFTHAGGGFANLDLWRRASDAAEGPLVALIGEASFHQFHEGTTTNVDDAEKDIRVRAYAHAYRTLRGAAFAGVHRSRLSFRGSMPSEFATGVRQRPLLPLHMDVTSKIRPAHPALHFDDGAREYLQAVYAESGLQQDVTWLGQPVGMAPADLVSVQQILHQLQPDAVIAAGTQDGLVSFIADVLDVSGNDARLLHVTGGAGLPSTTRLTTLHAKADDAHAQAVARHWVGSAEIVLVLVATPPDASLPVQALRHWGNLVSHRSWLICLGTVFGQPWLGYAAQHHLETIRDFVALDGSPFVIDRSWNRQLLSTCPSGYLRKVGGCCSAADYDADLDQIPSVHSAMQEQAP